MSRKAIQVTSAVGQEGLQVLYMGTSGCLRQGGWLFFKKSPIGRSKVSFVHLLREI